MASPPAGSAVLDFEGLGDGEAVVAQYGGLTFGDATVLTAGLSLNEFEFPPRSGVNVVFDDGGPLEIVFADPVTSVMGYFSYAMRLSVSAFDASNNLLGTTHSLFDSNLALSGDAGSAPDELLGVSFASGISRVTFSVDPAGGSFTLDDLTFVSVPFNGVPEPSTLLLLAAGVVGLGRRRVLGAG
jgi:hypothetical protein